MQAFSKGTVSFTNKWSAECIKENEEDERRHASGFGSIVTDKLLKALYQYHGAEAKCKSLRTKWEMKR